MNNPAPRQCDMSIKVCGMSQPRNIEDVATLTPMLMGFIFYAGSPRSAIGLDPQVVKALPDYVRPVAVFVDADIDTILDTTKRYGITRVQLHGNETPEMCRTLRAHGLQVFKALGIAPDSDINTVAAPYADDVDVFLFDTATPTHGGSGRKFDWDKLDTYTLPVPYLLSGGISPDDVDNIVRAVRPGMAGIDINSRFEIEPGVKNVAALATFILKLRTFNEDEPTNQPIWEKR